MGSYGDAKTVRRGNGVKRALLLYRALLMRPGQTIEELHDQFEGVCQRTVRRDLDVLESLGFVRCEDRENVTLRKGCKRVWFPMPMR